jgi:hypothetical protein
MEFSTEQLHGCAQRELARRKVTYPNRVLTGRLTQERADRELAMQQAIVDLLAELARSERLL